MSRIITIGEALDPLTVEESMNILGVSKSMVYKYKQGGYNPSLDVAITWFMYKQEVLHPFARNSLVHEINKMKG